jgi:hypothetical protein
VWLRRSTGRRQTCSWRSSSAFWLVLSESSFRCRSLVGKSGGPRRERNRTRLGENSERGQPQRGSCAPIYARRRARRESAAQATGRATTLGHEVLVELRTSRAWWTHVRQGPTFSVQRGITRRSRSRSQDDEYDRDSSGEQGDDEDRTNEWAHVNEPPSVVGEVSQPSVYDIFAFSSPPFAKCANSRRSDRANRRSPLLAPRRTP